MRKNNPVLLFGLLTVCFLSGACSKGGDDGNGSMTPKDILVSRTWSKSTYKENGTAIPLPACELDNIYTFYANGTCTRDEGGTKCISSDPQTFTDGWSLSADNKTIIILVAGGAQELVSISESSFTVRRSGATIFETTFTRR